jgi:hypothetical protein
MAGRMSATVEKAMGFVYREGRPVDTAELAYHLGRGRADSAVEVLYAYRNADGGFGRGVDPDVRHPGSTVLATCAVMQTLVRLKVDAYHPLVQGAMRFFVEHYDMKTKDWSLVTPEAKLAACAPWWKTYDYGQWGGVNARAEILSYFVRFDFGRHEALAAEVRMQLVSRLAKDEKLEMHEVQCVARLLRSPGIDSTLERVCREALERDLPGMLPRTKEQCRGYVLKPLTIARRPNSVLAGLVEGCIPVQHEYEVESQRPDGSWEVPWNWAEVDAAEWARAEREWRSKLTMLTASSLFAFNR